MSPWREETKTLVCGCKIGRSKGGPWFYDYLCEIHCSMVYDEKGHYSLEKAEELTKKLNEEIKKNPELIKNESE